MKKSKEKTSKYSVTLVTNGMTYKAQSESILDAIDSFGLDFTKVKTKGEITVEKGDRKATRLLQLAQLRRMFANKIRKHGIINNLEKLLA